MTSNIESRMHEHNSVKTRSTKGFIQWKLIFEEKCKSRLEARVREKYWKSGIGKEQLRKLK